MSVLKQMMAEREEWASDREKNQTLRRLRKTVGYVILLAVGVFVLFDYRWIINGLSEFIAGHL